MNQNRIDLDCSRAGFEHLRKWYVVHTRSRHEFVVKEQLSKNAIDVFLPIVEKLQRWKDRKKTVLFPLFPGYLFIHIERSHRTILSILKTKGVVRILGNKDNELLWVPDEQIASLQKAIDTKTELDPYPFLKEGNRVRIAKGPFAGLEGILVEKAGRHKLVLSVDVLCQSTSLKIDVADVESA